MSPAVGRPHDMSSPMLSVSVVVVCWNAASTLDRCLDHLLAQDHPEFDVIVVDDGSSDESLQVANRKLSDDRMTVVRSPLNLGCSHARNLGLRQARHDVIAFIDADGLAAPDWLRQLVASFQDPTVGAAASTVFFAWNPRILNGAGGTLNRRGAGADLGCGEPYEAADLRDEVLYPMGCGMAIRRSTAEEIGEFDEHIFNYYDDVDYGIRVWRAGYRIVLAKEAWVDHDFQVNLSPRKILLCERHRLRVMLKHASLRELAPWAMHEAVATIRLPSPHYELKQDALRWNLKNLPSALLARWRLRSARRAPSSLFEPSWVDHPVAPPGRPDPGAASGHVDLASADGDQGLHYGWFPVELVDGRRCRWSTIDAGLLVRLTQPARHMAVRYWLQPGAAGGVTVSIHPAGSLVAAKSIELPELDGWQEFSYPLNLAAGDYELRFHAASPSKPSRTDSRTLGVALSELCFGHETIMLSSNLDMASAAVEPQLVFGWHEKEQEGP